MVPTYPHRNLSPSLLFPHLVIVCIIFTWSGTACAQKDSHLVQTLITDAAFRTLGKHPRTGVLYNVTLPPGLASVVAVVVKYRSGSLRWRGGRLSEFRLPTGLAVRPYTKRIAIVSSNFGNFSSSSYGKDCIAAGYRLVSPVLSLLAYDLPHSLMKNRTTSTELVVTATAKSIVVDFSAYMEVISKSDGEAGCNNRTRCAVFEQNGKIELFDPTSYSHCATRHHGHFALVERGSPPSPSGGNEVKDGVACWWKVALTGSLAALIGASLLGLLCIAFVKERKRREAEEMERRTYEEAEMLQESMVGGARTFAAASSRTAPQLEGRL